MYYVDSQRTLTRRDSSLLVTTTRRPGGGAGSRDSAAAAATTAPLASGCLLEAPAPPARRPAGSVEREVVTLMFEAMLEHIVESWELIPDIRRTDYDSIPNLDSLKTNSEMMFKKTKKGAAKRKSRSGIISMETSSGTQDPYLSWWSSPDERAVVKFRNGNMYEGSLSMKCMNGTGRFQWANGTVYMGDFKNNEIRGRGEISWKDQTWYGGEFLGNLRHGGGLFVDARRQRSYIGQWFYGSKHGQGVIYYSNDSNNSYDGEWDRNVRHGLGKREYCAMSGYNGEWDKYNREGKGLMIWPNHDFYRGDWKDGVMSGHGAYIWDTYHNHSTSQASLNMYRGFWHKGRRNGYGLLNFGAGLGSYYVGEFKDNKKHGAGKLVTNDGLIVRDNKLFEDDIITSFSDHNECARKKHINIPDTSKFNMCEPSVDLLDHVIDALKNIDRRREIRADIINDFIQKNGDTFKLNARNVDEVSKIKGRGLCDIARFEVSSLRKALRYYETELRNIYYQYATVCNTEEILFRPVLIRLYLWQLYYDCNMHEKGLTMVQIDHMYHGNPAWLSKAPHNPFQKVYYWQFVHSLITVACRLYCDTHLPATKPDTIVAKAFRKFMDADILTGIGSRKGHLANRYAEFIPLRGLYQLYVRVGEPHTVRQFVSAARRPAHVAESPPPPLLRDADEEDLPLGRNAYVYGNEMSYIVDDPTKLNSNPDEEIPELKLFNFGNVSTKEMIHIFADIFPQILVNDKIVNLDIEITFFEFFEAFISCTEESIRIKEEELRWRERFSLRGASSHLPHNMLAASISKPTSVRGTHNTK